MWNKENRFTGWTNVDLSEKGVEEAKKAGAILKENGFHFTQAYTSYLKRAIKTLNQILDVMDLDWIPRREELAPQREALRYASGPQQG